jgi:hypothetical protein
LLSIVRIAIVAVFSGSTRLHTEPTATPPSILIPSSPIGTRVDDLMSRMTLQEKVGQLDLPCAYADQLGKPIPEKKQACKRFAAGT